MPFWLWPFDIKLVIIVKFLVIIQARCGSTRLPGKVMKPLAGKPAILRMVERVKRSKLIDEIVVATTQEMNNLPLIAICAENGIRIFVGSEDDVLDRYYQAARLFNPEYVVRVTADCPCFDATLLDEAIEELEPEADYMSPHSYSLPDGLDFEIIRFSALRKTWKEAHLASEREHVTPFIYNNPERFNCQNYVSKIGDHGDERWTVDEPEDYKLVSLIYDYFVENGADATFTYEEVLGYLDANPDLRRINAQFARNEGYAKSLREDHLVTPDVDE